MAYTIRETNWDANAYETEIWLAATESGDAHQLTNAEKSSLQPAWSPDGEVLGFISDRDGKRQLYRIDVGGGEAERLTSVDEGVTSFQWAPDGRSIAFTALEAATDADAAEAMLGEKVEVILDAGPTKGDVPSTIVDVTGETGRVLRPGAISLEQLNEVVSPIGATVVDEG